MTRFEQITRRGFLGRTAKIGAASLVAPHLLATCTPAAGAAPADGWQIGCYTRPWAAYDWRVALDAIAEAGFKHAGLMGTKSKTKLVISTATTLEEAHQVGQEARNRGLQIPSVYGGGIGVEKSLQAGIDGLRRLIDACAAAGAKTLLLGGIGKENLYQTYFQAAAECCAYAAEKRLGLTIKPHGGLNATGPQLRKAVQGVGHKNFSIWYDAGNVMFYSDGKLNPVDDAAAVDGLVTGWCVKDFRPAKDDRPKDVQITPGTGEVNFPAVLARLKQGGFSSGPLVIETLAPGDLPQLLQEAKKARRFVEELLYA